MEEKLKELENDIKEIKARNLKVESEKAWEISLTRKVSIALTTYFIAALVFHLIGAGRIFLNALVPTIGYLLSTLSLPIIKNYWIKKRMK